MAYEIVLAISPVLISFIFIYISTFLDKNKFPGMQFLFFTLGLIFIIIALFVCVVFATTSGISDIINIIESVLNIVIWLFVLVIMFFMFKFMKSILNGMYGKEDEYIDY